MTELMRDKIGYVASRIYDALYYAIFTVAGVALVIVATDNTPDRIPPAVFAATGVLVICWAIDGYILSWYRSADE